MSDDELNQAIQLIQQGQHEHAQVILQGLIRANQQDLRVWSWYVKSCRTSEKQLEALELCLRFNPGNPQILEAIAKLRRKFLSAVAPTPAPTVEPSFPSASPVYTREPDPYAYAVTTPPKPESGIQATSEPLAFVGLDEVAGRPRMWWDVWWLALRYPDVDTYTSLLRDPLANLGRAYWWIIMAGLVEGIIWLVNPDVIEIFNIIANAKNGLGVSLILAAGCFGFVAAISVLVMMLEPMFYNILAKIMGGTGNLKRTLYLISAYNVPLNIIRAILTLIPCVGLLSLALSLYSYRLRIAAVQAAHRLNGFRATVAVLLPVILSMLFFCLIGFLIATQVKYILPELEQYLSRYR